MIKFSVVIPLYNKEEEIIDTLSSVLKQSHQADEIIVVDDGSTDKSVEFIKENFQNKITLISQKNSGETVARNSGIREAQNEYIALLDADDLWENKFLEEIALLIKKYPEASFFSTANKSIDEQSNLIVNQVNFPKDFIGIIEDFTKVFSKNYGLLNSSSVCIRKSLFDKGIIFPEGEKRGGDLCYWLKLSLNGGLAFSAKPLSIYKLDASNRSGIIHQEAIVPCPIKWFYKNREQLRVHQHYKSIRHFIYSNIFITVYGGFALGGDRASIEAVIKLMKQNKDRFYLMLYPAYWVPVSFLQKIKKIRRGLR